MVAQLLPASSALAAAVVQFLTAVGDEDDERKIVKRNQLSQIQALITRSPLNSGALDSGAQALKPKP